MDKPKIYAFSTAYYPFVGGAEIAIQEVARRLKDRFDFYIVTSRMRRDLPAREVRPEGTIIRLGFGTRFDKWFLPLFVLFRISNFEFRILAKQRKVLLWGMDLSQGSVAAAILKFFFPRVPFVFTLQYGEAESRIERGRAGMIGRAFSYILSYADSVTAISSYLLNLVEKYHYRGASVLIPNGVDILRFRRPRGMQRTRKKIVVTTSRLVPKNGIDILIRAFARVAEQEPNAECWILGDGPELHKLKILSEKLKIANRIKFFGTIPHEEIPRYLHQASVFVRPSRSEGMGNSFVEALAAGLPVIGTRVGGIPDIIEDGIHGLFVKPDDPLDLAEKIIELSADRELSRRIADNGRARVLREFSWDVIADSYEKGFVSARRFGVVIATPFLPPRLGGPALYASHLGDEFRKGNIRTKIVSFDRFLTYPPVIRHIVYGLRIWRKARGADIIFSLDQSSVGLPAAIVARIRRIPYVLRLEGDFLWESYVERTRNDLPLSSFYRNRVYYFSLRERVWKALSSWVVEGAAQVVCSSEWRRNIALDEFRIVKERMSIIQNVIEAPRAHQDIPRKPVILWAGRMLHLKNLHRLIRAFAKLGDTRYELLLIGEGSERTLLEQMVRREKIPHVRFGNPIGHEELISLMKTASGVVLPSLSDVGPNIIGDAISTGTPFLMTKESGYAEYVKDLGVLVDPFDEDDILGGLTTLANDDLNMNYRRKLAKHPLTRGWPEAARDWTALFSHIES